MPLIETVTGPDLRTPDEVAEAILLVGRVCRSTGHVRVGLGASARTSTSRCAAGAASRSRGSQGGMGAEARPRRGGAAGESVGLRDELQPARLRDAKSISVESGDVTDLFATSEMASLRREAWEHIGRRKEAPRLRVGQGPVRRPRGALGDSAGTLRGRRNPRHSSRTNSRGGSGSSPGSTRNPSSSTARSGPTSAARSGIAPGARALHCEPRTPWWSSGAPRRTPYGRRTRSGSVRRRHGRRAQRDTTAVRRRHRPTSSASCPVPTACTPTPTARRPASRASGSPG